MKLEIVLKTLTDEEADSADLCEMCILDCKLCQPPKESDLYCGEKGYWAVEKKSK